MTRSQKVVFVSLGVILVLFVGVVIYGQTQSDPDCKGREEACVDKHKQGIRRLQGLFGSSATSVKLPQSRYSVAADGSLKVEVPAGSLSTRTLKLKLESGRAGLKYVNSLPDTDAEIRKQGEEGVNLPRDAKTREDRNQASFVVTKKGGTLSITCMEQAACVLVAE